MELSRAGRAFLTPNHLLAIYASRVLGELIVHQLNSGRPLLGGRGAAFAVAATSSSSVPSCTVGNRSDIEEIIPIGQIIEVAVFRDSRCYDRCLGKLKETVKVTQY